MPRIAQKINSWKYIGYEQIKHKKNKADFMLFYTAIIGDKEKYIEVLLHKHFGEVIYCIVPFEEGRDLIKDNPLKNKRAP